MNQHDKNKFSGYLSGTKRFGSLGLEAGSHVELFDKTCECVLLMLLLFIIYPHTKKNNLKKAFQHLQNNTSFS